MGGALVSAAQRGDHRTVRAAEQDAFQHRVVVVVQHEPGRLLDQGGRQTAGLVGLAQHDPSQVVLLDLTDQGWWRSRS
jgi:hypothetical protein